MLISPQSSDLLGLIFPFYSSDFLTFDTSKNLTKVTDTLHPSLPGGKLTEDIGYNFQWL